MITNMWGGAYIWKTMKEWKYNKMLIVFILDGESMAVFCFCFLFFASLCFVFSVFNCSIIMNMYILLYILILQRQMT